MMVATSSPHTHDILPRSTIPRPPSSSTRILDHPTCTAERGEERIDHGILGEKNGTRGVVLEDEEKRIV